MMKIPSGTLVILIIYSAKSAADGADDTFEAVMKQFYSILKHNTVTVDVCIDLATKALGSSSIEPLTKLIKSVNKALFIHIHDLYVISMDAKLASRPSNLSPMAINEVAQMCNHSAALKEAIENIGNMGSNFTLGSYEKSFQLMPMGPPRSFRTMNQQHFQKRVHQPEFVNSNLEVLLANVEEAMAAKRWIFLFIQGFLVGLVDPPLALANITYEIFDQMHDALFKLLGELDNAARSTPDLVVEDVIVTESTKLRNLAVSIQHTMTALGINLYGYH